MNTRLVFVGRGGITTSFNKLFEFLRGVVLPPAPLFLIYYPVPPAAAPKSEPLVVAAVVSDPLDVALGTTMFTFVWPAPLLIGSLYRVAD